MRNIRYNGVSYLCVQTHTILHILTKGYKVITVFLIAWTKHCTSHIMATMVDPIPAKFKSTTRKTPSLRGPRLSNRASNLFTLAVQFACDALISCERQLNTIDLERGDGDTGSRIRQGAQAVLKEMTLERLKTTHPFTFFQYVSRLLEVVMGGTLGCIYSILFEAVAGVFADLPESATPCAKVWLLALKNGTDALQW